MKELTSNFKFLCVLGVSAGFTAWWYLRRLRANESVEEQENLKPRYCKRYIELESWMIGAIIGKKGYTILRLQMQSKCLLRLVYYDPESALKAGNTYPYLSNYNENGAIDLSDDENWNDDVQGTKPSEKTPFLEVVFREEAQYNHLLQLIQELVSNVKEKRVHRKIFIPKESALYASGLYGRNIKKIHRSTRVIVEISHAGIDGQQTFVWGTLNANEDKEVMPEGKVAVFFYGPEKNIETAEEMLLKYVEDYYYKSVVATNQKSSLNDYEEQTVPEILETIMKICDETNAIKEL